jgi:PAS domain S-box-containing protein
VHEQDLEDFFENGAVGLHLVDRNGIILRANRAELELLGYGKDEYVGRKISDFHADEHIIGDILARLSRGERLDKYPARLRAKDGSIKHVLITSSALFKDGKFINTRCFTVDVTEQRRADEAARASELRLSHLLELAPLGIGEVAPDGRILYANQAAQRMLTLRGSHIEGRRYDDPEWTVTTPEGVPIASRDLPVAKALQGKTITDHEFAFTGPDSRQRVVASVNAMPLRTEDGTISGALVAFTDVTARHQAEAALREREAYFRTLANNIPQLAWMANPDGLIFWYNQRWFDYTGTTPEEMEWRGWQSVHDPEVFPEVLTRWHTSLVTGEAFDMVFPIKGADGVYRPFLTRVEPVCDGAGNVVRWFGTNTDITEQHRIEEALRTSEAELYRLNETLEQRVKEEVAAREHAQAALFQAQKLEAIGQLTGGVAHDFNNLLTTIIGNLELLNTGRVNDLTRRRLEAATRSAEKGARLTQQLLAYARRQHLSPQPVDLNALIDGLDDMLRRTLGGLVQVETRLGAGLWHALGDPTQLELTILNLAINARDAMPLGGSLIIETTNLPADKAGPPDLGCGDYIHLTVTDTGTGMTPEIREKAMDPFFTTKEIGKGSGLGLSQVYGVVKQCGGTVQIESESGKGTTVHVWLPRASEAENIKQSDNSRDVPDHRRATVLVVDDDVDVREVTVDVLKGAGYHVEQAASGAEALDILERQIPIDLVVVDYAMPRMSGAQFVTTARVRQANMPAVFVTGYADPHDIIDNANAVIVKKPYRASELLRATGELLAQRTRIRQGARVIPLRTAVPTSSGQR